MRVCVRVCVHSRTPEERVEGFLYLTKSDRMLPPGLLEAETQTRALTTQDETKITTCGGC